MIAIPAVDIRDGACVQLVGGSYDAERIRLENPAAVARQWAGMGFARLHVVDLDAATDTSSNAAVIRGILDAAAARIQVGGGVRSTHRAAELLAGGASSVVVGTRAIEDPDWLAEVANEFPGSIIVAADVRDRRVVTHGWSTTSSADVIDFIRSLDGLPLGGLLVTAVHREGQMIGPDLPLMEDVVAASAAPVTASGGISSRSDLCALDRRGVRAAVIGMALYTGALDARATAEEFGQ
jgi:phosphoribosylformimino-5-aminoimidazole carboxamide ribotide isomerase